MFSPCCPHTHHLDALRSACELLLTNTEMVIEECWRDLNNEVGAPAMLLNVWKVSVAQTLVSTRFWCENRVPCEIWSELKCVCTHTHARVQCYTEAVQEGNIVAVFNGICKLDIYNALFLRLIFVRGLGSDVFVPFSSFISLSFMSFSHFPHCDLLQEPDCVIVIDRCHRGVRFVIFLV